MGNDVPLMKVRFQPVFYLAANCVFFVVNMVMFSMATAVSPAGKISIKFLVQVFYIKSKTNSGAAVAEGAVDL